MEKKLNKNAHLLQQDSKVKFANFICSQDNGLSYPNMTECERYGMTWGCDKDCPVFQRKECELQEENNKQFEGVLSKKNSIEEDIKYIEDVIALAIVLPTGEVKIQEKEIETMKHILSDYKRVLRINEVLLKENEILKEENARAWEEWNNLEQGSYETEQRLKQQIKELQKENEKLKESRTLIEKILDKGKGFTLRQTEYIWEHYIPVQEVKDIQKTNEWALRNYCCDEADYKQSQAIGAWNVCEQLLRMGKSE